MTPTVFEVFAEESYEFLNITRGGVYGNQITSRTPLKGIFKLRSSSSTGNNIETRQSTSTLHAHPEDYKCWNYSELVGQGICKDGIYYQISDVTEGKNFDNGLVEHLTFTLERADYV